ncbi:MAG: alpha-ketoglutarate-dependent dioxygenase AlkB [Flavobacterium sp.]|nr:alpha-ketoglutarate-dependent dioxygenase AlkB [Flavobacterium sp.]
MDLFTPEEQEKAFEVISLSDGEILFMRNFFTPTEAKLYFDLLQNNIDWKQEEVKFYGKTYPVPRKTAWYGYEGFNYSYSGITCFPEIWTKELLEIKNAIEQFIPTEDFTSVLLNLYNNGNDKMGWHADDEKELGTNPIIASVSLGETRRFDIKHKHNKDLQFKFELTSGSLLIMRGALQHHWVHQIPAQKKVKNPRINLTFRTIKKSL